jgi:hypothetical protein
MARRIHIGLDGICDDALSYMLGCVHPNDRLAVSLTCRAFRLAPTRTSCASVMSSVHKLEWALSCSMPQRLVACGALRAAPVDVLEWIIAEHPERCGDLLGGGRLVRFAAERGDLDVLKWAIARGTPWDKRVCASAAIGGHMLQTPLCSHLRHRAVHFHFPAHLQMSASNTDRQCNPRLFGDGFVLVTLAMGGKWNKLEAACIRRSQIITY